MQMSGYQVFWLLFSNRAPILTCHIYLIWAFNSEVQARWWINRPVPWFLYIPARGNEDFVVCIQKALYFAPDFQICVIPSGIYLSLCRTVMILSNNHLISYSYSYSFLHASQLPVFHIQQHILLHQISSLLTTGQHFINWKAILCRGCVSPTSNDGFPIASWVVSDQGQNPICLLLTWRPS